MTHRRAPVVLAIVVVAYATLFPFDLHVPAGHGLAQVLSDLELELLHGYVAVDGVPNVALFVPLGFALAHPTVTRRRRVVNRTGAVAVAIGIAVSATVEVVQGLALARHASVSDVVANALGTVVGVVVAARHGDGVVERLRAARAAATRAVRSRFAPAVGALVFVGLSAASAAVVVVPVATRPGRWDPAYPLVIGNESDGQRPWSGFVGGVYLLDRAVSDDEAVGLMSDPAGAAAADPAAFVVAHDFEAGTLGFPELVWDGSGTGPDRPLVPLAAGAARTVAGGVAVGAGAWLTTPGPAAAVSRAVERSGAFTAVMTVTPTPVTQFGPARLVSISEGLDRRNLTIGQSGRDLVVRIRTVLTGPDGTSPEIVVPEIFDSSGPHDVVVRYDGVGLVVGVDGDPVRSSITLAPEIATLVATFPTRTERIRLETVGPSVLRVTFAGLLYAPLVLVGRGRPLIAVWWIAVVAGAASVVRWAAVRDGLPGVDTVLIDLTAVAALWVLTAPLAAGREVAP